jgi:hypothetical protein
VSPAVSRAPVATPVCECALCAAKPLYRDMPDGGRVRTTATYFVPTSAYRALEDKIAKLVRKAAKLGCDAPSFSVGEEFVHAWYSETPRGLRVKNVDTFRPVTVTGKAPGFAGWRFVATLQTMGDANIVRGVPGEEVPEIYRTRASVCDHCKTKRKRTDTYVLRHEDGRAVQVGRSCVRDFLGHDSPAQLCAMAEMLADLTAACGDGEGEGGGGQWRATKWDLLAYLASVVADVKELGWTSSATAKLSMKQPTSSSALHRLDPHPKTKPEDILTPATPADAETAKLVLAHWLAVSPSGDYEHNVCAIARAGIVDGRTVGIAASMVTGYDRAIAKARERDDDRQSRHFGTVGKREVFVLTVIRVFHTEGLYGTTHIHMMKDAEGNVAKWFSSSESLDAGKTYSVKGTVKKHDEYQGAKQTILTRCAATEVAS